MIDFDKLSPEGRELLAEIMRQRAEKIPAEIAKLEAELRDVNAWLAKHAAQHN